MPPVTHSRVYYNNSWKSAAPTKGKVIHSLPNPPSPRRRRPRNNSKSYSKNSPKNQKKETVQEKIDAPKITYDRDALLSLRQTPMSSRIPDLPVIPGVTAPRPKSKEMPESLRQKLLKRGVVIRESKLDNIEKECDHFQCLSIKEKNLTSDVTWQSCMYHLI